MIYFKRITLSVLLSGVLMTTIAWSKGNKNFYHITLKEDISPLELKDPEPGEEYYEKIEMIKTVYPSSIPLFWESRYDTLGSTIMEK